MSISFFEGLLPEVSRDRINKFISKPPQQLRLAELFLIAIRDTSSAIGDGKYKKFDALIKNFGCQITALEVLQKVQSNTLKEEACAVHEVASQILNTLIPELKHKQKFLDPKCLFLSEEFLKLTRFYLLNIVNSNVMRGEEEVPCTCKDPIYKLVSKIDVPLVNLYIDSLQSEESRKAADYIAEEAKKLKGCQRFDFLRKMILRTKEVPFKNHPSITSIPLLYSMETVLRRIEGIVLVKSKMTTVAGPVLNAVSEKIFIKMPEEYVLTPEVISQIDKKIAVYVIEGYVKSPLREAIAKIGLFNLMLANSAMKGNQYVGNKQELGDEEAENDRISFDQPDLIHRYFKMDHTYINSMREEL